ncbi:hypothetical protein C0992_001677, partial [Termitomyces sp. T32_za158]
MVIKTSGDSSAKVSSKVSAAEDGRAPKDIYVTRNTGESEELETDDYEPAVDLLLQPDADDDGDKRTEPASGTLGGAPRHPSSNVKNGGGVEDGEADAEGEVDAE